MDTNEFKIKAKRLLMNAQHVNLKSEAAVEAYLNQSSIQNSLTFGGNTPCIEITEENSHLVIDCGSGLAALGKEMIKKGFKQGNRIDILQTHTHWDHMMGFPFFAPAYLKNTEIHIHGVHPDLKKRFKYQMDLIHFPITMDDMKSSIVFHQLSPGQEINLGPFIITNKGLHHPGGSYAYRISSSDKNIVFASDGEYINLNEEFASYIEFYRDADVLIFDAMYATLEKTIEKENYGHSTPVIGINIALTSNIKTLFLFHHDPDSNDSQILEAFNDAQSYLKSEQKHFSDSRLELMIAYDSLVFDV